MTPQGLIESTTPDLIDNELEFEVEALLKSRQLRVQE
jgi:hypothetical protein